MVFDSKKFLPNSIKFREVSSLCISKYKEAQAFALGELVNNPTHKFSKTAKEILLLKYDVWFRWLVEVEEMLRRSNKDTDIKSDIIKVSDELEAEYNKVLNNYCNIFDARYVDIWTKTHKLIYKYFKAKVLNTSTNDKGKFMASITDMLIIIMDNTLFELHEIDNLIKGNKVFVSFDDICLDYPKVMGTESCLLVDKLAVYKEYFPVVDVDVVIKDYSKDSILKHDNSIIEIITKQFSSIGLGIETIV